MKINNFKFAVIKICNECFNFSSVQYQLDYPWLIAYYRANKPEESDWVVLPVSSLDSYFGNTSFSKKWLNQIPEDIMERQKQSFGVWRYRITSTF